MACAMAKRLVTVPATPTTRTSPGKGGSRPSAVRTAARIASCSASVGGSGRTPRAGARGALGRDAASVHRTRADVQALAEENLPFATVNELGRPASHVDGQESGLTGLGGEVPGPREVRQRLRLVPRG